MTKFNTLQVAQRWVNNSAMSLTIMLGDDSLFWVVRGRAVKSLEAQGYSRA